MSVMNGPRWMLASMAVIFSVLGEPYREPWERACLASVVASLCILVLVGPAKAHRRTS